MQSPNGVVDIFLKGTFDVISGKSDKKDEV